MDFGRREDQSIKGTRRWNHGGQRKQIRCEEKKPDQANEHKNTQQQERWEDQKERMDQKRMTDPKKVFFPSPFSCNGMWEWPFAIDQRDLVKGMVR